MVEGQIHAVGKHEDPELRKLLAAAWRNCSLEGRMLPARQHPEEFLRHMELLCRAEKDHPAEPALEVMVGWWQVAQASPMALETVATVAQR